MIPFLKFISKYFVFDAIVKRIDFFLENLLLVHRNATDFCMLILYLAALLNLLITSNGFLVG